MFQSTPGKPYLKPHITVNGTVLNNVEKFTYLGSTTSRHVNIDKEVICRSARSAVHLEDYEQMSGIVRNLPYHQNEGVQSHHDYNASLCWQVMDYLQVTC